MARYREYLHNQVRELLTSYGEICYLFYDFSYPEQLRPAIWGNKSATDWDAEALMRMTRELQPGIVINDRLGIPGDLVTPEQYQPAEPMRRGVAAQGEPGVAAQGEPGVAAQGEPGVAAQGEPGVAAQGEPGAGELVAWEACQTING